MFIRHSYSNNGHSQSRFLLWSSVIIIVIVVLGAAIAALAFSGPSANPPSSDALPPVRLQTSTPGTQQTGNLNISGAALVGGNVSIGTLSIGGTAVTATAAELNFVDGVTSAIQTQLNAKAPLASPTFTGTVSGITATMVGLGNVTNESKATMFTSPTFTGNVTMPGTGIWNSSGNVGIGITDPGSYKVYVNGNSYVNGTSTIAGNLTVNGSAANTCTRVSYTVGGTVSCPQYYYTNTIGTPTQSGSIICCKVDNPT